MTESDHCAPATRQGATIAIVTPTWNRRELLARLFGSLRAQSDKHFVWVVVDDNSTDSTEQWLAAIGAELAIDIRTVRNERNLGKCASLNRAFDLVVADFYLVVDSDDYLIADALRIVREKVYQYDNVAEVGAIFFSYRTADGTLLASPAAPGGDVVMTRANYDAKFGKYDGCVGYYRRVVEQYRYPEFPGETYVGPTVLQLKMAPVFAICFTNSVVGIAEYQLNGLTADGRRLRVKNPLGMMKYTQLQRQQAPLFVDRFKNAVMFYAYQRLSGANSRDLAKIGFGTLRWEPVKQLAGALMAYYWGRKFADHPASDSARRR